MYKYGTNCLKGGVGLQQTFHSRPSLTAGRTVSITFNVNRRFTSVANSSGGLLPRLRIVMDLDECMVSSRFEVDSAPDYIRRIPGGDFAFLKCTDGMPFVMLKRPGVHDYLAAISEVADVYMYTAGIAEYGISAAAHLDPHGKIFRKVLCRNECVLIKKPYNDIYAKDLQKLGDEFLAERTLLVDNNIRSFYLQPSNGLLIKDFVGDINDNALADVSRFILEELQKERDIRPLLVAKYNIPQKLKAMNLIQ